MKNNPKVWRMFLPMLITLVLAITRVQSSTEPPPGDPEDKEYNLAFEKTAIASGASGIQNGSLAVDGDIKTCITATTQDEDKPYLSVYLRGTYDIGEVKVYLNGSRLQSIRAGNSSDHETNMGCGGILFSEYGNMGTIICRLEDPVQYVTLHNNSTGDDLIVCEVEVYPASLLSKGDCGDVQCGNGGTCHGDTESYQCTCVGGFWGKLCEFQGCEFQDAGYCENGGDCIQGPTGIFCDCHSTGYRGKRCEEIYGEPPDNGVDVEVIRPCQNNICAIGGWCREVENEFICNCTGLEKPGFNCSYKNGSVDMSCPKGICTNGVCRTDENGLTVCNCSRTSDGDDDEGLRCVFKGAEPLPPCGRQPCQNEGICSEENEGYSCDCSRTGYVGEHCEIGKREQCSLPSDSGSCEALIVKYYYNARIGRCEVFNYGGCKGNTNNFNTLRQCEDRCKRKGPLPSLSIHPAYIIVPAVLVGVFLPSSILLVLYIRGRNAPLGGKQLGTPALWGMPKRETGPIPRPNFQQNYILYT